MQIGAQFYTVREQCKTLDDFALTLKKVADIGYKTVQISGTCPYEADWLKEQLAINDLKCVLTHIPVPKLVGETEQVIADHFTFDCPYIGLGYYSFDESKEDATYDHFMKTFVPVAEKIRAGGKYFMYHNHDNEFKLAPGENKQIVLEKLAEEWGCTYLDVAAAVADEEGLHPGYLLGAGGWRRSCPVGGKAGRACACHPPEGLRLRPQDGRGGRGQHQL